MSEWQPIETAPTDQHVPILVWDGSDISIACRGLFLGDWYGMAAGETPWGGDADRGGLINILPTHWMPLPEPPGSPSAP